MFSPQPRSRSASEELTSCAVTTASTSMPMRRPSTVWCSLSPTTDSAGSSNLNVFATGAALEQLELDRPLTILTHQLAWTVGVGRFIEPLGARPAARSSAEEALADGHNVLVFPGGDLDAAKSWQDRNRIVFGGRSGFASLAIENNVPIVPVVTVGTGESPFVMSSGERLARATRLDKAAAGQGGTDLGLSVMGRQRRRRRHPALPAAAHQATHPRPSRHTGRRR